MSELQHAQLVQFLESDLAIPTPAIALALRQGSRFPEQLPMVLWHYGLISLDQLAQIFDWIEMA